MIELLRKMYTSGMTQMICVSAPGVKVSPNSRLRADDMGKVPALPGNYGWYGYNWRMADVPTESQLQKWVEDWRANIGLRADYWPAIDVDCTDPDIAQIIRKEIESQFGSVAYRIGQAPKFLVPMQTDTPFRRQRLWMRGANQDWQLVEILGSGQQYLIGGTHAGTGQPYAWHGTPPFGDSLPRLTAEFAAEFLDQIRGLVEMLGWETQFEGTVADSADRDLIDQDGLKGRPAAVEEAVALIPNDNVMFPGRHEYIQMAYAIRAAMQDADDGGFALFSEWAARWEGNDRFDGNDPDTAAADWARVKPPFSIGARFIFEIAEEYGFNAAGEEFNDKATEHYRATNPPQPVTRSALQDQDAADGATLTPAKYSEMAVADEAASRLKNQLAFNKDRGTWLEWTGCRWAEMPQRGKPIQAVGQILTRIAHKALADQTLKESEGYTIASRLGSYRTINSVIGLMSDKPVLATNNSRIDGREYEVCTPDGNIDLISGKNLGFDRSAMHTQVTQCGPYGYAPRWQEFIHTITLGREELKHYLQKLAGYCLVGNANAGKIFMLLGEGANGKSVFVSVIQELLGTYSGSLGHRYLVGSSDDTDGLKALRYARMVHSEEPPSNRRWKEEQIKRLTGGDRISIRELYVGEQSFTPISTIIMTMNDMPDFRYMDHAMRRRIVVIPFDHTFPEHEQKKNFRQQLLADEGPGIMQWMVKGAIQYLTEGLDVAPNSELGRISRQSLAEATPILAWANDCLRLYDPESDNYDSTRVTNRELRESYRTWCINRGYPVPNSLAKFPSQMKRMLNLSPDRQCRDMTGRGFQGMQLIGDPEYSGAEFSDEKVVPIR